MSAKKRVELGIVGGFVASALMAMAFIVVHALGLMQVPWFVVLATLSGSSGAAPEVALNGLIEHLLLGVLWGVLFALVARRYNVVKGLTFGGILLLLSVVGLVFVRVPQLSGTILTISWVDALRLLVSLAVAYGVYGATVGYAGRKYLE